MSESKKGKGKKKKKRSHCIELLPRVAPGPVVGFVKSSPHSHQLVTAVIEDGPGKNKKKMNAKNCLHWFTFVESTRI